MSAAHLENERDRAEWLQCLQAAATAVGPTSTGSMILAVETVVRAADQIFAEYRKRCNG